MDSIAAELASKLIDLCTVLGIDPDAALEQQIEEARELADAPRQLRRAYAERDEALQTVRELDDRLALVRAELKEAQETLEWERQDRAATETYLHKLPTRHAQAGERS